MTEASKSEGRGRRVLLIEDDKFKQELVEQALRAAGVTIDLKVGRSVQQAVHLVRSGSYDLIILDVALPSHESRPGGAQPISQPSGGLEVLLELAYEERGDRVVIVTQYPEIEYDGVMYPLINFKDQIIKTVEANIVGVILFNPQEKYWHEEIGRLILCDA
ncbi:DNA-binding transcriptional regulator BasR [compost metagenome]